MPFHYRSLCSFQNRSRDKKVGRSHDTHIDENIEQGDITDGKNLYFRYAM